MPYRTPGTVQLHPQGVCSECGVMTEVSAGRITTHQTGMPTSYGGITCAGSEWKPYEGPRPIPILDYPASVLKYIQPPRLKVPLWRAVSRFRPSEGWEATIVADWGSSTKPHATLSWADRGLTSGAIMRVFHCISAIRLASMTALNATEQYDPRDAIRAELRYCRQRKAQGFKTEQDETINALTITVEAWAGDPLTWGEFQKSLDNVPR